MDAPTWAESPGAVPSCGASRFDIVFHSRRVLADGRALRTTRTSGVDMKARLKRGTVPEAIAASFLPTRERVV
jgi:hypothetical protein